MKDSIKNVLWFGAIFITLMTCCAISFNAAITEPLCEFSTGKNAVHPICGWLLIYFVLSVGIPLASLIIQLVFAGKYLNRSLDLICNHQKSLNHRMYVMKYNPLWAHENNVTEDWAAEDAEYEKELDNNEMGYKYFSYLWDNGNED